MNADAVAGPLPARPAAAERLLSRDFVCLWLGDSVGRLGFQVAEFLLPLVAVTVLEASPTRVGFVTASQFVPVLVLSLSAGALVGRRREKALLVGTNLLRAGSFAALALTTALIGVDYWSLVVVALVIGSVTVVYDIAYQTAIPKVLTTGQLLSGNGVLQASTSITQMAGPALAGVLVEVTGLSPATAVTAALFAAGVVGHAALHRVPVAAQRTVPGVSIGKGLWFTWRCRPVRDLCIQSALFNLHEQAFLTAFLIYAVRTLDLNGGVVGTIIGAGSVGALVGSVAAGRLAARLHVGIVAAAALPAAATAFFVGTAWPSTLHPAVALVAAFVVNGIALATYNVFAVSLRQAIPPTEYLAATTATYRMASFGTIPLGAMAGGVLVSALGARPAVLVVAGSMCLTSASLFLSPLRSVRTIDDACEMVPDLPPGGSPSPRVPS